MRRELASIDYKVAVNRGVKQESPELGLPCYSSKLRAQATHRGEGWYPGRALHPAVGGSIPLHSIRHPQKGLYHGCQVVN